MMPALMAARLISFANACFVKPGVDYDGGDFAAYTSGLQATTRHRSHSSRRLSMVEVSAVEEMAYHVIGTRSGEPVHSFIGLKGQCALSVLGRPGTFGISQISDLMRVYGAVMLGQLESIPTQ